MLERQLNTKQMLIIPKITFVLLCNSMSVKGSTDLYIIKVKQMKCFNINPEHILNATCNIKAERHKHGLINIYFIHHNVDRVVVHAKLFYQNSAGRYLPTFFDYSYNFCEFNELLQSGSKIFQWVIQARIDMGLASKDKKTLETQRRCPLNVSST